MPTNERRGAIQGRCARAQAVRQDWRGGIERRGARRGRGGRGGPNIDGGSSDRTGPLAPGTDTSTPARPPQPRRYHGTVTLEPARVGRDAGRVADEVLTHLVGLVGSSVRVTLEIEAEIPAGVPDNVVRTVTENSRTLKFTSNSGFEKE
jgi:hypothetical protein